MAATPIKGADSRLESRGLRGQNRVNVPIKGIVTEKGSISGTGVRNSDSRTIDDQDWEGAPRLKVFAPGHGGEA